MVKLLQIQTQTIQHGLDPPLDTAHGKIRTREGTRVVLSDVDGFSGIGETMPLPAFGTESAAEAGNAILAITHALDGAEGTLESLLDQIEPHGTDARTAMAAFDFALHDLFAHRAGVPVAMLLADAPRQQIDVHHLISDDFEELEHIETTAVKIKVAHRRLSDDVAAVKKLRSVLGPDVGIRLDANGGWNEDEANTAFQALAVYGIEFIEEPVAVGSLESFSRLPNARLIPIAIDESLLRPGGYAALIEAKIASVAVLKPSFLGGLRRSLRLGNKLLEAGLGVVVTHALERELGNTAAAHLAAALGGDEVHGVAACTGTYTISVLPGLSPAARHA